MGKNSAIEWTDHTWNPWRGCHKVSAGCKNCYMFRDQKRYGKDPNMVVRASDSTFYAPMKWGESAFVFTCSWSDWFIEEADEWRGPAWSVIYETPHLTYLILTKRPERIAQSLPRDWGSGWPNVWLGVSIESAEQYHRLTTLETIPAALRFISYEPALGPVNFAPWLASGAFGWVISGGESDLKAPRPADPAWFLRVKKECRFHHVAFFLKQLGGNRKIDGSWGGRMLNGRTWDERPALAVVPPDGTGREAT